MKFVSLTCAALTAAFTVLCVMNNKDFAAAFNMAATVINLGSFYMCMQNARD